MPLQEIPLDYLSSRVKLNDLKSNSKLLSEEEIKAVIARLDRSTNGHYKKAIFNRIEMATNNYSIIKFDNKYYAIYKGKEHLISSYDDGDVKIKLAQDLESGEWFRLKISTNKDNTQVDNEFKYLKSIGLAVTQFTRITRHNKEKQYLLMKLPPGLELNTFIQRDNHISTSRCLEIVIGFLKKIKAVHHQNYLLCKLTLHNIFYDSSSNEVNLGDYDAIVPMDEKREANQPMCGTDIYIAPELLNECELIELIDLVITHINQVGRKKLNKTALLQIVDTSPILVKLEKEKKEELVVKLQTLSESEFDRLANKIKEDKNLVEYTYNEKTESYSVGIIIKLLLHIPVKEISHFSNQFNNKYYKIGKEKVFQKPEHGQIIKFLDSMTTKNPDHRASIDDALEFFQEYYKSCLPFFQIKVGIVDIRDFEAFAQKNVTGFWTQFKNLAHQHQIDEVYIISKKPNVSYLDTVKIKVTLSRMGIIFNNAILVIPCAAVLAEIPAHIEAKKNDSILRSYTYFNFSKYSPPSNYFVDETPVKENGISIQLNGHQPNGIIHDTYDRALEEDDDQIPGPVTASVVSRIIGPNEINKLLTESGINVITIDADKPWNLVFQEMSKCVMTITKKQFDTIKRGLESEFESLDKKLNGPKHTRGIHNEEYQELINRRTQIEKVLGLFNKLQNQNKLSYTITHNALDILQQHWYQKKPPTGISQFFSRAPVPNRLLSQIKPPDSQVAKGVSI